MLFEIGEKAILNEKAIKGLPDNVGEVVEIVRFRDYSANYDYEVEINGDISFVKEKELNKLTDEQKELVTYMYKGNNVFYIPTEEEVTVLKIDFLHNQVEVWFEDGSTCIVPVEKLMKSEKERGSVKEKFNVKDLLIDTFLSQYKNNDNTYTVPKIVLQKLIKHMIEEVE